MPVNAPSQLISVFSAKEDWARAGAVASAQAMAAAAVKARNGRRSPMRAGVAGRFEILVNGAV